MQMVSAHEEAGVHRASKSRKHKRKKSGRTQDVQEQSAHVLLPSFQNMVPNISAMPIVKENLVAL